jgi:hypothetical protein
VLQGLDEFPGISEEIKYKVDLLYQEKGLSGLQNELKKSILNILIALIK